MKVVILFCLMILLVSCNQNAPQKMKSSPSQPVVENFPATHKAEGGSNFSNPDENEIRERKAGIKRASTNFGLSDLELFELPNEDVEIRLWHLSGLGMPTFHELAVKKSVFILRRTSGNWSADIIRDTIDYSGKQKTEKRLETKLGEPKSGWENVWQNLVEDEILTLPDGKDVGVLPCPDCGAFQVEIKNNGEYRFYRYGEGYYTYGKEDGFTVIREARQMIKIANTISDEFDIEDLKTAMPKLEGYKP